MIGAVKLRLYHWLAVIPPLGMLVGVPLLNRPRPLILGLPPLMAWIILWILVTPVVLGVIFALDRTNES
jgi:uncharacterized protein DUF3311